MNLNPRHAADDDTAVYSIPELEDPTAEVAADVDLDEDPFADGLSERLAEAAPRRWRTRTTVILTALVLAVGGFAGGLEVEKHWGDTGATAAGPAGFNPAQSGSGFAPGNLPTAAPSGAANATTGTVKLVDGGTVYITTSDGRTVTVKTSGSTAVQTTQGGSLTDLAAGSTVTVQGQTGSDGSVNATSITKAK